MLFEEEWIPPLIGRNLGHSNRIITESDIFRKLFTGHWTFTSVRYINSNDSQNDMPRIDHIGLKVYSALGRERSLTAKEIADKTHLPVWIVAERLKWMESLALVIRHAEYRQNPNYRPGPIEMDV